MGDYLNGEKPWTTEHEELFVKLTTDDGKTALTWDEIKTHFPSFFVEKKVIKKTAVNAVAVDRKPLGGYSSTKVRRKTLPAVFPLPQKPAPAGSVYQPRRKSLPAILPLPATKPCTFSGKSTRVRRKSPTDMPAVVTTKSVIAVNLKSSSAQPSPRNDSKAIELTK